MDLIEKEHPELKKIQDNPNADLSTEDAIKTLQNHPETFIHPALINGPEFIRIKTPHEVVKNVSKMLLIFTI
ncbi:hypothetical protein MWU59_10855 [Flavobacteriaceae bacterium F08102]|nr:hypothetical protein [Flavobacteriaceae bacterium F08102]